MNYYYLLFTIWIGVGLWLAYALAKDYDFWPSCWGDVIVNFFMFLFLVFIGPAVMIGFFIMTLKQKIKSFFE